MHLSLIAKNVSHCMAPYFKPSRDNAPRIATLISYIGAIALKIKYNDQCYDTMYKATSFFRVPEPQVVEFPHVFKQAVTHGLIPIVAIDAGFSYLQNQLIILLRNSFIRDQIKHWLQVVLKEVPMEQVKNVENILVTDSSTLVVESVRLIQTTADIAHVLLSIVRVYRFSAKLTHASLPFPFNHKKGLFAIVLGLIGIAATIHILLQKVLAQSGEKVQQIKQAIISRLHWLNDNRQQMVSLPQANRDKVMDTLNENVGDALKRASRTQQGYGMQWNLSFLLPMIFEITTSRIDYLFVMKAPQFDVKELLPQFINESIRLLWKFSFSIQNAMNSLTSFQNAVKRIEKLTVSLALPPLQITVTAGDVLAFDNITLQTNDKTLLGQFSVSLPLGYTYYVQGTNGVGKSMLCRLIQKLQDSTGGTLTRPQEVIYLKHELTIESSKMNFQQLLLGQFGLNDVQVIEAIKERLKQFSSYYADKQWKIGAVENNEERNWAALSAGEKQILNWIVMTQLAQQNPNTPCLLIGDEALNNLAAKQKDQMLAHLKTWVKENPTKRGLLIIDHSESMPPETVVRHTGEANFQIYQVPETL